MDIKNIELEPGTSVQVFWVDGDMSEGMFVRKERGYIVLNSSGSIHACLPAHLTGIKVLGDGEA